MRRVLIACPAYNGQVDRLTVNTIDAARDEGRERGWDVRSLYISGSADIADIRNQVIGIALKAQADDLLMIDADVSASGPGTFAHIMAHDVDFVAGLYRMRTDAKVVYPVRWPDERVLIETPNGPLLEAIGVPAGFLRITGNALRKMSEGDDVKWVQDDEKCKGVRYPFISDWTWHKHGDTWKRLSEDYTLSERWREVGGTVWVDPALKLNHTGPKVFPGDFMAQLGNDFFAERGPVEAALARASLYETK
jgi:hypothetical protein